ncbi:MAG: septum formation initiator family protein [Pseudomonadota bacterium]
MEPGQKTPAASIIVFSLCILGIGGYFAVASVQGESGLFRRIQIEAEAAALREEKAALEAEVALLKNLTRRLSDEFLDLDLLDQQARIVLGYIRADELIIR